MMDTIEATVETRQAGRRRRAPSAWPPLLVLLAGVAVLTLVLLDGPSVVRAVAVLAYLAAVPGLAWVRVIRVPDGLAQFVLGVAVSLSLGILVAQAMVALGHWSPRLGLSAVVAMGSLAAAVELARTVRDARDGSREHS